MIFFAHTSLDEIGESIKLDDALAIFMSPPIDCNVSRKLRGYGDDSEWNLDNWLLAELIDELRVFFMALAGSKKDPPRIPRPGVEDDDKKTSKIETAAMTPSDFALIRRRVASKE